MRFNKMRLKRLYHSLRLATMHSYIKKAQYIKKHNLLEGIGDNCQWGPRMLPVYTKLIKIHNNVTIHKTAKLVPHDVINAFLKRADPKQNFGHYERLGCIEIMDNVYVSMNVIILPNVRINRNCIISAGSVVMSDIPENSIVAGNPARVVGTFDSLLAARAMAKDENVPFRNQQLPDKIARQKWERFLADRSYTASDEGEEPATDGADPRLDALEEKIIGALAPQLDGIDLRKEKHLIDQHLLDSLGMITVVSVLESTFGQTIPFSEINAANFNSARRMAKMIGSLSGKETGADVLPEQPSVRLQPLQLKEEDTLKPVVRRIMEFAARNPDAVAVIADDRETTFGELASMILSAAGWLKTVNGGVKQGDCVVVQAVHNALCLACYYAVHLIGAKLVPAEETASPERILDIVRDTGAVLVIGTEKRASDTCWADYGLVGSKVRDTGFDPKEDIAYPDIDWPCEMVFTTGTTGKSKGVLMTHRHISWYCNSVAECVGMKAGNRFLLTTPLNHAGGLRRTHLSLANGCCMVYLNGLSDLGKYFSYIRKYQVTSLYLPPLAIRILLTRTGNELAKYQDQIDFVYSSSSALPDGDCQELRKLLPHTRLYNAYEASETPGVSAYDYNTDAPLKNCLGRANPGVELAIMTEDGSVTKQAGVVGQICVKSRMNMAEYYGAPELTASVFKDGWFVSNDLGHLDAEGNVYYGGRKGDVINIGGYKIAPTDVEETALKSGMIDECICVEDFDEYGIPFLKLLVVVGDKNGFDAKALTDFISGKLEAYKIPRKIECTDSICKTFNGKLDRKAYRNSPAGL